MQSLFGVTLLPSQPHVVFQVQISDILSVLFLYMCMQAA